MSDFKAKMQQI